MNSLAWDEEADRRSEEGAESVPLPLWAKGRWAARHHHQTGPEERRAAEGHPGRHRLLAAEEVTDFSGLLSTTWIVVEQKWMCK